jgi:valyl-tRNA synthetase
MKALLQAGRNGAPSWVYSLAGRLYTEEGKAFLAKSVLLDTLKLLAPILPFVTEEIYQGLFASEGSSTRPASIHTAPWPTPDSAFEDERAEVFGRLLVQVATAVRRYKSEHNLALGSELARMQLVPSQPPLDDAGWAEQADWLAAIPDLKGVTRAREIELAASLDPALHTLPADGAIRLAIAEIGS